ncbi:MAG: hypothetical protein DMF69_02650 [Acidobacteria bacterium]|nr:MAG: hypothetical protein DMF69_02650 [Acidobacteriota bacterium]
MNCDCTENISLLIDGELDAVETRALERHLVNCLECQEARADFLSLRSQLTDFPVSFQPVAQREALARILGKEQGERRPRPRGWRWAFNPPVAAFASLLILAVVFALLVYPRLKSKPETSVEVASGGGDNRSNRRTSVPTSSPAPQGTPKKATPKKSPAPATGEKKIQIKKSTPIFDPQPDNIAKNVATETGDTSDPDISNSNGRVRSADAETMTAIHLQKAELLLRSFRNVRTNKSGSVADVSYEKKSAQQLVFQNMMLRREADAAGDAQVSSLLESLEPILLDIANLPAKPRRDDVRVIKDRVERKNIVPLLQVNSNALARALD